MNSSKVFSKMMLLLSAFLLVYFRPVYAEGFQWKTDFEESDRRFTVEQALEHAKQLTTDISSESIAYSKIVPIMTSENERIWNCTLYCKAPGTDENSLILRCAVVFIDETGQIQYRWDSYHQILNDWESVKGSFLTWDPAEQALYDQLFTAVIDAVSKKNWFQITQPEENDMQSFEAIEFAKRYMRETLCMKDVSEDDLWFASHITEYDETTWHEERHEWYIYCCKKNDRGTADIRSLVYWHGEPYVIAYNAFIDCNRSEILNVVSYQFSCRCGIGTNRP